MQVKKYFKPEGKLEIGCLVFAGFNLVTTLAASVVSAACLIITITTTFVDADPINSTITGALIFCTAFFCLSFAYAVILINGLHRKNAQMLNTYFTYGVVVIVLLEAGAIAALLMVEEDFIFIPSIVVFVICFIYSMMLVIVRMTYKKFESSAGKFDRTTRFSTTANKDSTK